MAVEHALYVSHLQMLMTEHVARGRKDLTLPANAKLLAEQAGLRFRSSKRRRPSQTRRRSGNNKWQYVAFKSKQAKLMRNHQRHSRTAERELRERYAADFDAMSVQDRDTFWELHTLPMPEAPGDEDIPDLLDLLDTSAAAPRPAAAAAMPKSAPLDIGDDLWPSLDAMERCALCC